MHQIIIWGSVNYCEHHNTATGTAHQQNRKNKGLVWEEYLLRATLGTHDVISHKVSMFCRTGATNFNVDVHCRHNTDCYSIEIFVSTRADPCIINGQYTELLYSVNTTWTSHPKATPHCPSTQRLPCMYLSLLYLPAAWRVQVPRFRYAEA